MSTMNLSGDISLDKDSKRLSMVSSQSSLNLLIEEVMGLKSESQAEMESEAKQKKIDHFVTHAEKVHCCHNLSTQKSLDLEIKKYTIAYTRSLDLRYSSNSHTRSI